jgi:hypothetical protein
MALYQRNGIWHWRKMINGVSMNRSTQTGDKKLADKLVKKWEHDAVQSIKYDGKRPVTLYEAIDSFLDQRKHLASYTSAKQHMQHWKDTLANERMPSLQRHRVQAVVTKRLTEGAGQYYLGFRDLLERDDQPLQGQQANSRS